MRWLLVLACIVTSTVGFSVVSANGSIPYDASTLSNSYLMPWYAPTFPPFHAQLFRSPKLSGCSVSDLPPEIISEAAGKILVLSGYVLCSLETQCQNAILLNASGVLFIDYWSVASLTGFPVTACLKIPTQEIFIADVGSLLAAMDDPSSPAIVVDFSYGPNPWKVLDKNGAQIFACILWSLLDMVCLGLSSHRLYLFFREGDITKFKVAKILLTLEIIAATARLISNLDPWGTRGILTFDVAYIFGNTMAIDIFLINNILIAYAWQCAMKQFRKYAKYTIWGALVCIAAIVGVGIADAACQINFVYPFQLITAIGVIHYTFLILTSLFLVISGGQIAVLVKATSDKKKFRQLGTWVGIIGIGSVVMLITYSIMNSSKGHMWPAWACWFVLNVSIRVMPILQTMAFDPKRFSGSKSPTTNSGSGEEKKKKNKIPFKEVVIQVESASMEERTMEDTDAETDAELANPVTPIPTSERTEL
eukprot:TRINITY_DN10934_c0_g1_i1.p1 TRINITY_DN10934_c0_g1~~TRINITY_DN10934_c0_g1_i1.p1  ORF type:complete len:478 (-),score=75.14 TRINITY_DN10934_c0_g1_i1:40-1473(-)